LPPQLQLTLGDLPLRAGVALQQGHSFHEGGSGRS
jgi:hypothetical protein